MASFNIDDIDIASVGGDILCEFLEVAIHCILHNRGLYPAGVFEKYKKYNVPVQMCTHPEVKHYIAEVIDGIRWLNDKGEVEKVTIVIFSHLHQPLERFVFEIAKAKPFTGIDTFLYQLEQSLRAFILKLNVSEVLLKSLPEDCTWTIQVHTKESAVQRIEEQQIDKNFPWTEVDERETNLEESKVFPLKAVDSEYIKMQLLVEESSAK